MKSVKAKVLALGALSLCAFSAQAVEVSWNGFGSAYYGQALSSDLFPSGFTDKHVNFTSFSLMGLNVGAKVNDDLSFAAQLVALGSPFGRTDKFGLAAQWAYVNYTPTQVEGLSIRGGRQLLPLMMASEYVRVGYLLPFRQIPATVYNLAPFSRFDGVSAYQTVNTPVGRLTLGVFGGTPQLDTDTTIAALATTTFTFADLLGAVATLDGDGWRLRAAASRNFNQIVTTGVPVVGTVTNQGHNQNYSAGARYDKNNIVFWGEYLMIRTPDGTPSSTGGRYIGNGHGYYLLGGYRIGNFMPRYTFAQGSQTFNLFGSGAYNGQTTSHTVGLNYTAGQAVIKLEWEKDLVPVANGGGYTVTQPAGTTATSGSAFYAGVDFIF
jgi:hypothetical protein